MKAVNMFRRSIVNITEFKEQHDPFMEAIKDRQRARKMKDDPEPWEVKRK